MTFLIGLTNGLVLGAEHLQDDEDDEFAYIVVVHLLFIKLMFCKNR